MLRSQEKDDLRRLGIRQRIGKGRHLLPAVLNLLGDLGWCPELVLSDIRECRSLLRTLALSAMTVGASFVSKQNRAGHFIGLLMGGECRAGEDSSNQQKRKRNSSQSHVAYFRMTLPVPSGRRVRPLLRIQRGPPWRMWFTTQLCLLKRTVDRVTCFPVVRTRRLPRWRGCGPT